MSAFHPCVFLVCASLALAAGPVRPVKPVAESVILASASLDDWRYLAFPALHDAGDEVLVSYKRARSHAQDAGAALELARLDPLTGQIKARATLARVPGEIMQMGEWVRFPNGDLVNYIDAQRPGTATTRTGLLAVRSTDGGRTFGEPVRVGLVDGVEYGYAFDRVVEGSTTWMLAMTFANLTGGKSVFAGRPMAGSVDVLRSDDSGRKWHRVRELSHEFGDIAINESALVRWGDGFLVTTRGYDNRQRLHLTDGAFRLVRQSDLTALHSFVQTFVGRPRLLVRDGHAYLLGRNVTRPPTEKVRPMQLCLLRLEVPTLTATDCVVLDNAALDPVTDGYYAMGYFRPDSAGEQLHVVTYRGRSGAAPDLVHLAFRWQEVR
jgi:hypothetical protein